MAEKKQTYKEIVEERDAYKHELDVIKQDRVNRQAKNSVFLNLFIARSISSGFIKSCSRRIPPSRKMTWK